MSERDELARLAKVTRTGPLFSMTSSEAEAVADRIIAAGYRKPRTITTVEELDALPETATIRDSAGDVAEKWMGAWHVWNHDSPVPLDFFTLPAAVLWEPQP